MRGWDNLPLATLLKHDACILKHDLRYDDLVFWRLSETFNAVFMSSPSSPRAQTIPADSLTRDPSSFETKLAAFREWQKANTGLQLIALSQLFFSGQTLCVKILQDENGMPVMQIVFVRMVSICPIRDIWVVDHLFLS
jgi:hypothetical protein